MATTPLAWSEYLVPAGRVAIVKTVTAYNGSSSSQNLEVAINTTTIFLLGNAAYASSVINALHIVLQAGDRLRMYPGATGVVGSAHGYELVA